jgi:hypothetical protein
MPGNGSVQMATTSQRMCHVSLEIMAYACSGARRWGFISHGKPANLDIDVCFPPHLLPITLQDVR